MNTLIDIGINLTNMPRVATPQKLTCISTLRGTGYCPYKKNQHF
jgi:hypothetical protein